MLARQGWSFSGLVSFHSPTLSHRTGNRQPASEWEVPAMSPPPHFAMLTAVCHCTICRKDQVQILVTKLAWLLKTEKEIIKKPEREAGQLNFPPLLCGTRGPAFQAGRGLWHRCPMPGSQADVAGTESRGTSHREGEEEVGAGRDDGQCLAKLLRARHTLLSAALGSSCYPYPHFTDLETEAQRSNKVENRSRSGKNTGALSITFTFPLFAGADFST